jgi:Icc-related predicted phosphoesterase
MIIVYVTDLHGAEWKYERLVSVARRLGADLVINGGDMLPKQHLHGQKSFIEGFLAEHFAALEEAGIGCYCCLGNDDLAAFDPVFDEVCARFPGVENLAQRLVQRDGYGFLGMNWVTDYPFRLKDRCRRDDEDFVFPRQLGTGLLSTAEGFRELPDWFSHARALPTLAAELERLPAPEDWSRVVCVMHMPPSGLGLDRIYTGDEVGSRAMRRFLERRQPLLSLHGHIHESPLLTRRWQARLGRTVCIQPGQLQPFTYVKIDLARGTYERFEEPRA